MYTCCYHLFLYCRSQRLCDNSYMYKHSVHASDVGCCCIVCEKVCKLLVNTSLKRQRSNDLLLDVTNMLAIMFASTFNRTITGIAYF